MGRPGKWNAPHNAYLQAFVELGTPGGLIFLALLATAVAATFRLWRPRWGSSGVHRPEFLAAVVSMMASAYFLSHAYAYHVLIIFALTTLAQRAFRNAPRSAVAGPVYPHRMRGLNRSGPRAP